MTAYGSPARGRRIDVLEEEVGKAAPLSAWGRAEMRRKLAGAEPQGELARRLGAAKAKKTLPQQPPGTTQPVGKGVAPRLARIAPAAGRGGRRVVTGDQVNARRVVGKALGLSAIKGLRSPGSFKGAVGSFKGGLAAGRTGASRMSSPAGAGARGAMRAGSAIGANPMKTGAVAGAGLMGGAGMLGGSGPRESPSIYTPPTPMYGGVGKRSYDPESERRFRQGAYATGTGVAGAGALGWAGRQVRRDTRSLDQIRGMPKQDMLPAAIPRGEAHARGPNKGQPKSADELAGDKKWLEVEQGKRTRRNQASGAINNLRGTKGHLVRGRSAAAGGAGLALLGTSGALIRSRHEERWD